MCVLEGVGDGEIYGKLSKNAVFPGKFDENKKNANFIVTNFVVIWEAPRLVTSRSLYFAVATNFCKVIFTAVGLLLLLFCGRCECILCLSMMASCWEEPSMDQYQCRGKL